ncbi:MAG: hypothetical protein PHQ52_00410 [Candidatus Omnitrophica bacterium]|nr:hypothetical protein [Candidatus Omnitrophota bacterium]
MDNTKKKYKKAIVKAVLLNSEQAIMQVCAIGGVYFNYLQNQCIGTGEIVRMSCGHTVRGKIYSATVASIGAWDATSPGS